MMNAKSPEELGKMEGELRGTLKTLFAVQRIIQNLKLIKISLNLQS